MSESIRQRKFASLIQKTLSEIFQRDRLAFLQGAFFSISGVRMTPDLSIAKVYVSMSFVKEKDVLIKRFNHHSKELRKILGTKIAKQVRGIPLLVFYLDETTENAERIDALLDLLKIPPEQES